MGSIDYVLILKVDWIHTWKLRFDSVPFVRQVLKRKSFINFFAKWFFIVSRSFCFSFKIDFRFWRKEISRNIRVCNCFINSGRIFGKNLMTYSYLIGSLNFLKWSIINLGFSFLQVTSQSTSSSKSASITPAASQPTSSTTTTTTTKANTITTGDFTSFFLQISGFPRRNFSISWVYFAPRRINDNDDDSSLHYYSNKQCP